MRRPRRGGSQRPADGQILLVARAVEILEIIRTITKPADYLLGQYFRDHPRIPTEEKGVLAEWVYGTLRYALYFAELARGVDFPHEKIAAASLYLWLLDRGEIPAPLLRRSISETARVSSRALDELVEFATENADLAFLRDETERLALQRGFPAWVAEQLREHYGLDEVTAILDGLNGLPLICLRANREKVTREALRERLRSEGIRTRFGKLSPDALILREGGDVFRTAAFRDGLFEVQDEGSQVVSLLVGPKPGARIFDACAGACGKALHIAALMRGRGEVYAFDTDARRLANAGRRVRRSGLQNIRVLDTSERFDRFSERHRGDLDSVLVDAPCTGLGTVRRSPDIKLRATPSLLADMTAKQRAILEQYSPYVRSGGRLIYATCSILPEENRAIVDWFLERHPEFRLLPVGDLVAELPDELATPALRELLAGAETMQLYPHLHGTDGFFAAVMDRE